MLTAFENNIPAYVRILLQFNQSKYEAGNNNTITYVKTTGCFKTLCLLGGKVIADRDKDYMTVRVHQLNEEIKELHVF